MTQYLQKQIQTDISKLYVNKEIQALARTVAPTTLNKETKTTITTKTTSAKSKGKSSYVYYLVYCVYYYLMYCKLIKFKFSLCRNIKLLWSSTTKEYHDILHE